ncbi:MAG: META domain-containing protein [Bacteroidota bacterium]
MKTACVLICGVLLLGACTPAQDSPSAKKEAKEETTDESLPNQRFLMKLWQEGIDFYARGNEPSWALDIDFDTEMRLMTMGGLTLNTPAVEGIRAQDADVTRYAAESDSGSLVVTISAQKCADTMSGEEFTHRVRVEVKSEPGGEEKTFEACGRYVPDYSLNDIWVLTHLNGDAVDGSTLQKGSPTMELHMIDNRLAGHGGCNNIMGSFAIEWKSIRFGAIASTLMACPDMTVETDFLKAISGRSLTYRREDGLLVLSGEDDTELKFKKVD